MILKEFCILDVGFLPASCHALISSDLMDYHFQKDLEQL
jgi:hypothetical protein